MGERVGLDPPEDEETEEIRSVVPARAVLTELARGFLLLQESSPERAVRFAASFLRERSGTAVGPPPALAPVTPARLALGRLPRGAVEPASASRRTGGM